MSRREPHFSTSGALPRRAEPRPAPARPPGTPRDAAIPRLETVRVTAPDLARRAALETSRRRLLVAAGGFSALFAALAAKLTDATVINPVKPPPRSKAIAAARPLRAADRPRAMMVDRNGEILAVSLPTAAVYADPRQMMDRAEAVRRMQTVVPGLNGPALLAELMVPGREFVYVAREVGPEQELRINDLGIPGVNFLPAEARHYPLGRTAAQVLGAVDIDGHGIAGLEKSQNRRLREDPNPLRLSIDVRVQAILRDEMAKAVDDFQAIGAAGIVMDVLTGEVLAMASLPDYNANDYFSAPPAARFNRAATGVYEPGSAFKLQTVSMALDPDLVHVWDRFNTTHPITIGRFAITDYEPVNRWLYLPEIIAYSSNIGAARIALIVGKHRQRAWLRKLGFFERCPIELPEAAMPLLQSDVQWGKATVMTVAFGNGIAITPLHLINATLPVVNGGVLFAPTLLYQDPTTPRPGSAVMKPGTSDTVRKLMRDVVLYGTGIYGRVPGYFVGGKTGTSQVIGRTGYRQHTNLAGFLCAFPINAPRYALYIMVDAPHDNALDQGYSTGGEVSAPAAARTIARIAPMLGLLPVTDLAERKAIEKEIALPLHPTPPPGVVALGPSNPYPPGAADAPASLSRGGGPGRGHALAPGAPRRYAAADVPSSGR
ncbi:MAG: penicillin-binding protein 2 [Rhodospirillales bacterium]|nr:penicillin-binding protein 2 [Rhodospirillales bacterium]